MSRNGSGTYTLPAGNPVVTGTTIESTWANTTLSDIATTLTDSLSRSGQGGMTAALRLADGTQGAPGVAFANETGTGLYRAGTGEVWAVVQGAQTMNLDATGVTVPADKATSIEGTFVFNETGADKDARFEGDTDANLLFVDASTNRVGVGTNAPTAKLNVEGSVVINDLGADVDVRIEGDMDANLLFVDASTDRIGIGTDTPSYKVDVNGAIAVGGDVRVNGNVLGTGSNTTIYNATGEVFVRGGAGAKLSLGANNTNDLAVLTSAGDLGVGTASPTSKLNVYGAVNPRITVSSPAGTAPGFTISQSGQTDVALFQPASSSALSFYIGSERMRLHASGGVSIGNTTDPGSTNLSVTGTVADGTSTLRPLVSDTAKTASGSSVDFTGIPSWVRRITVMFSGVSLSGTSNILVQLGDAGGVETTGYIGGSSRVAGTSGIDEPTNGFSVYLANATRTANGALTFSNLSGNIWAAAGVVYTSGQTVQIAGAKTLSDTLTQILITTVNGTDTFDAGSINIMYE